MGPRSRLITELIFWMLGRRRRWRVGGTSMEPAFADGEHLLVEPVRGDKELTPGQVVVARHPFKNIDVVKYVASQDGDYLALSSPQGDDSAQFGRVHRSTVFGIVRSNLSRRGVLARTP